MGLHRFVAVLALLPFLAPGATAATFRVDSAGSPYCDGPGDALPGDGICATSAGGCTLEAAQDETEALPGHHEILLDVPTACEYSGVGITGALTITGTGDDDLGSVNVLPGAVVELRNVRVTSMIRVASGARLVIEDCELRTSYQVPHAIVTDGELIVRNLRIPPGSILYWGPEAVIEVRGGTAFFDGGSAWHGDSPLLAVVGGIATLRDVAVSGDSTGPDLDSNPTETSLIVKNGGRLRVESCDLDGGGRLNTGVRVDAGGHADIARTRIHGVFGDGISSAGSVSVSDCTIEDGYYRYMYWSAQNGYAAHIEAGTARIERSVLRNWINESNVEHWRQSGVALGGGMRIDGDATVEVLDTSIENCRSRGGDYSGGSGAALASGTLRLERCLLTGNTTGGDGAALHVSGGTATIVNTTLTGNRSDVGWDANDWSDNTDDVTYGGRGGAIFVQAGTLEIFSSTIANNGAELGASGVHVEPGARVIMADSILANGTFDCAGTLDLLGYVLIQDDTGCDTRGDFTGVQVGVDPLVLPLADNGGLTFTMALDPASPAFDAADPAGNRAPDSGLLDVDQRGAPRPADGDGDGVVRGDLGAVEHSLDELDSDGDGIPNTSDPEPVREPQGLRVRRVPADLARLEWTVDDGALSVVVAGHLARLRSGELTCRSVACALDVPWLEVPIESGSTFWLVGARWGAYRSPLGHDSFGDPMPGPSVPCP